MKGGADGEERFKHLTDSHIRFSTSTSSHLAVAFFQGENNHDLIELERKEYNKKNQQHQQ